MIYDIKAAAKWNVTVLGTETHIFLLKFVKYGLYCIGMISSMYLCIIVLCIYVLCYSASRTCSYHDTNSVNLNAFQNFYCHLLDFIWYTIIWLKILPTM